MAEVDVPAPGGNFAGATTDRGRTPGGRFNGDGISGFVATILEDSILWIGPNPPSADQYVLWINTQDARWYGKWNDGDSVQWVDLSLPFGEGLPGPRGAQGERGLTGPIGEGIPTGGATNEILVKVDGTDYNTTWGPRPLDGLNVLTGTTDPLDISDGVDGEHYINTTSWEIFGPKAAGAWPAGVSLIGPQGPTGATGTSVLTGVVAPTTEGNDGDVYIDTATSTFYGPKAAGTWPAGTSLIGAAGADGTNGTNGTDGAGVPAGGTANQIIVKQSGTDFDTAWADAPVALPVGGTDGQVLTKLSAADGDAGWETPTGGAGGVVSPAVPAVVRDSLVTWRDGASTTAPFPAGALAGDTCVIVASGAWQPSTPVGWTDVASVVAADQQGKAFTRVLTDADIIAGSVTVSWSGNFEHSYSAVAFVGAHTIRYGEVVQDPGTSTTPAQVVTNSDTTDKMILVGAARASSITITSDTGVLIASGGGVSASAAMYEHDPLADGGLTVNWTFSGAPNGYTLWAFSAQEIPAIVDGIVVADAITVSQDVTDALLVGDLWQDVDPSAGDVTLTTQIATTGNQPVTVENIDVTNNVIFAAGASTTINSLNGLILPPGGVAVLMPKGSGVYRLIGDLTI